MSITLSLLSLVTFYSVVGHLLGFQLVFCRKTYTFIELASLHCFHIIQASPVLFIYLSPTPPLPTTTFHSRLSYGAINAFPSTPSGNSLSPSAVVCAQGFSVFSLRMVAAKQVLHFFLGYAFVTLSIVAILTSCGWPPILSKIVASWISASMPVVAEILVADDGLGHVLGLLLWRAERAQKIERQ
jgi:hypothetical protein